MELRPLLKNMPILYFAINWSCHPQKTYSKRQKLMEIINSTRAILDSIQTCPDPIILFCPGPIHSKWGKTQTHKISYPTQPL